jgi:hypothetical protein
MPQAFGQCLDVDRLGWQVRRIEDAAGLPAQLTGVEIDLGPRLVIARVQPVERVDIGVDLTRGRSASSRFFGCIPAKASGSNEIARINSSSRCCGARYCAPMRLDTRPG